MKFTTISALALAVVLYCAPTLAQHGHPGGVGGGMGSGMGSSMGHGSSGMDHGAPNMSSGAADHGMHANSMSMSHGQTMDQILTRNTKLAGKIQDLTGMGAQQACAGFKNLGQCVAAAHVSKNLGISFACLQADMTGAAPAQGATCPPGTGTKAMSLGKSIQALQPKADSKAEAKKANKQADQDFHESQT
jgi:hypothetical protein